MAELLSPASDELSQSELSTESDSEFAFQTKRTFELLGQDEDPIQKQLAFLQTTGMEQFEKLQELSTHFLACATDYVFITTGKQKLKQITSEPNQLDKASFNVSKSESKEPQKAWDNSMRQTRKTNVKKEAKKSKLVKNKQVPGRENPDLMRQRLMENRNEKGFFETYTDTHAAQMAAMEEIYKPQGKVFLIPVDSEDAQDANAVREDQFVPLIEALSSTMAPSAYLGPSGNRCESPIVLHSPTSVLCNTAGLHKYVFESEDDGRDDEVDVDDGRDDEVGIDAIRDDGVDASPYYGDDTPGTGELDQKPIELIQIGPEDALDCRDDFIGEVPRSFEHVAEVHANEVDPVPIDLTGIEDSFDAEEHCFDQPVSPSSDDMKAPYAQESSEKETIAANVDKSLVSVYIRSSSREKDGTYHGYTSNGDISIESLGASRDCSKTQPSSERQEAPKDAPTNQPTVSHTNRYNGGTKDGVVPTGQRSNPSDYASNGGSSSSEDSMHEFSSRKLGYVRRNKYGKLGYRQSGQAASQPRQYSGIKPRQHPPIDHLKPRFRPGPMAYSGGIYAE